MFSIVCTRRAQVMIRQRHWRLPYGGLAFLTPGLPPSPGLGTSPSAKCLLRPSAVIVRATVVGVAGRCRYPFTLTPVSGYGGCRRRNDDNGIFPFAPTTFLKTGG